MNSTHLRRQVRQELLDNKSAMTRSLPAYQPLDELLLPPMSQKRNYEMLQPSSATLLHLHALLARSSSRAFATRHNHSMIPCVESSLRHPSSLLMHWIYEHSLGLANWPPHFCRKQFGRTSQDFQSYCITSYPATIWHCERSEQPLTIATGE